MEPIIEIRGLVNEFGTHRVHDGLDLSIYQGEVLGIVGGSGSGKSVLLHSIIGLHEPNEGEILIRGQDITKLDKQDKLAMQRLWGVLFQAGALFSSLTVKENVALPILEFSGLTEKEAHELAEVKIELVGLKEEARDKYPAELSGGMVKRAALARALALDPRILFLDEPTAGLDPISAAAFDTLIRDLSQNLHLAVVMITHDLDSLFAICDRVAVLVDKKIKVDSLPGLLQDDHPWIHDYFHGPRARAVLEGRT